MLKKINKIFVIGKQFGKKRVNMLTNEESVGVCGIGQVTSNYLLCRKSDK